MLLVPWVFYLMKWTWDLDMKKIFILLDTIYIVFFWKTVTDGLNEWLEVTLAENTIQKKMAMYKKDDGLSHQNNIKVLNFYCNQRSRFTFIHLMLQKSVKSFITEYIPDVRTIISWT